MNTTPVWVGRSLALMAVGAILALAITWHDATFDIQTAGEVLLCVGAFDFVFNLCLMYYVRSVTSASTRRF